MNSRPSPPAGARNETGHGPDTLSRSAFTSRRKHLGRSSFNFISYLPRRCPSWLAAEAAGLRGMKAMTATYLHVNISGCWSVQAPVICGVAVRFQIK